MNELSSNPITQVIIFHDGSKKFITESQASLIMQSSNGQNKSITTPNLGMISFSSIAKVITLKEYYEQYPDQVPEYRKETNLNELPKQYETLEQQLEGHKNQFKGVLKGLKSFIDEEIKKGNKPLNAIKTYEEKLKNYKQKFKYSNDQIINEIAKDFNGELVNV